MTTTPPQALSGLSVVELGSDVSAPYAAKLLADLGATVIKVEPPTGDPARRFGPFPGDVPDAEQSGLFLYLNTNKNGVVLDLETEEGRRSFRQLVSTADVLIENTRPGTLERLGLSYEALSALNPRLVMTSISPFGQDPEFREMKAYPLNIMHGSGTGNRIGEPGREPLSMPGWQSSYCGGISAAGATLCAIYGRDTLGRGQYIDISELEVLNCFFGNYVTTWVATGGEQVRAGPRIGSGLNTCLECKDGYVHLIAIREDWWKRLVQLLGDPEWAQQYEDRKYRGEHAIEVEEHMHDWLMSQTREELFELCQAERFPVTPYYTIEEVVNNRQLEARGFFVEIEHPEAGTLRYPGAPYRLSETPWQLRAPAPLLGQHNREVLGALPQEAPTPAASASVPRAATTNGERPLLLEGIRVLDFSIVWAGPVLGQILADNGAEVIRVESRLRLDDRGPGPGNQMSDPISGSVNVHVYGRGKKSITVNMAKPEGIQLMKELVKHVDVVSNNFTPHVMKNWGMDYEQLSEINPGIITISLAASGLSGPLMNITTYAPALGALVGLEGLAGYWGERPLGSGLRMGDPLNGNYGVVPVLTALLHRERTGRGQDIDMSQWESWETVAGEYLMDSIINGRSAGPQGNRDRNMAPHNVYRCSGDDEWVSIAVGNEEEWQALCQVLGDPPWTTDPRYTTMRSRWEHQEEMDQLITKWTRQRTKEEVTDILQHSGVAALPSRRTSELLDDPISKKRGTYIQVEHPMAGVETMSGVPWRMSETPPRVRRHGPLLGEHNEEIFCGLLGLSPDELAGLEQAQVVY